jgi:hypothetical protein
MDAMADTSINLVLPVESVMLLDKIADKSGESREDVACQAIQLWLERYREHGPAFSRAGTAVRPADVVLE